MWKSDAGLALRISGNGPIPVVFLHGFLGSGADWDPTCEALGDAVLAVRIDLPGHGNATGLSDPSCYTMEGCVREITAIAASFRTPRVVFVGYSMGGRVALEAALTAPDRCAGLFLESASPGLESADARSERLALDRDRASELMANPRTFLGAWYEMPIWASLRRRPDVLEQLKRDRLPAQPDEPARTLVGLSQGSYPGRWSELSRIRFPVLALAGAEDTSYAAMVRRMTHQSERIRAVVVEESGHNVHVEKPEVYIETLKTFLTACGAV